MPLSFLPRHIFPKLTAIDPRKLHESGVRLLMLDFDNTIVPYNSQEIPEETVRWFHETSAKGFPKKICRSSRIKSLQRTL